MLYALLSIAFIVPLAISRPLLMMHDQFDLPKLLILRTLILAALLILARKIQIAKKLELRWSNIDFALIGFLALALVSAAASIHLPTAIHGRYERYEGFLTLLNYGILYILALQVFSDDGRLSRLNKTIMISGLLVAFYGVMQYFGIDPLPWTTVPFEERRSFSTFGNPDLLAGFLVLAIPVALAEFMRSDNTRDNVIFGGSLFLLFVCLLTAFTRSAWIGAVISLFAFAALGGRALLANPRKLIFMGLLGVSVFGALAVFSISSGHNVTNLVERIISTVQITEGSAKQRIEIWTAASKMVSDKPLLGFGPDTFRLSASQYETYEFVKSTQGATVADNAHNYIVQLATTVGIPAAVLLVLFFILALFLSVKRALQAKEGEKLTYVGLLAAFIGYLVHLFFGISVIGSSAVFWIICGALIAATAGVKKTTVNLDDARSASFKVVLPIMVLFSAVAAYFSFTMVAADHHYHQALYYTNIGNPNSAIMSYEKAISLYKNGKYYDDYGAYLEKVGWELRDANLTRRSIIVLEEAIKLEPDEADHYIYLANTLLGAAPYAAAPELNYAAEALDIALSKRPKSKPARVVLAQVRFAQNRYEDTIEALDFVMDVSPYDIPANILIAKSSERLRKPAQARLYYEKVLSVQPDNEEARDAMVRLLQKPDRN